MLIAAVKALAAQSPALRDPNQGLLPDVEDVRDISVQIAKAVIHAAVEEGLAHFFKRKIGIPDDEGGLDEWVREQMWDPVYRDLELVEGKKEKEDLKEESGIKGDDAQATS
jgi:malate dehydrogenase (oxaloacetate-decarboxylating)